MVQIFTKQDIINTLSTLYQKYDRYEVLKDWFALMACSIEIPCLIAEYGKGWEEAQKQIDDIRKRYGDDSNNLIKAYDQLIAWIDFDMSGDSPVYRDWLGEIYMESCIASKEKAQHFTPYQVSKLCAELNYSEETVKKAIEEKGYVTFNDPCVGAGCLPIAFCATLRQKGINYQEKAVIVVGDNDQKCCDMCYVQLSLIGAPAIVENKDALTQICTQKRKTVMLLKLEQKAWQERRIKELWESFKRLDGNTSQENPKHAS